MPRPPKWRCVTGAPAVDVYKPAGVPFDPAEAVRLRRDQLEALRLLDVDGLTQQDAAARLGVSRSTVSRLASEGRRTLVGALLAGQAVVIEGGPVAVRLTPGESGTHGESPSTGGSAMVIAVPHEAGQVNQHFGRTREFLIARSAEGSPGETAVYEVPGMQHNHGALAGFLQHQQVDVILAGGMGAPMQAALKRAGFDLYCGVSGPADEAVAAFLRGEITQSEATCGHHHGSHEGHHEHHEQHRHQGDHHAGHGEGGCGHHHDEQ